MNMSMPMGPLAEATACKLRERESLKKAHANRRNAQDAHDRNETVEKFYLTLAENFEAEAHLWALAAEDLGYISANDTPTEGDTNNE
jgi:hypothetical protein